MLLNADLTQRAVVDTNALAWVPAPENGVERRLLERDGGEVAPPTSIVRYARGSRYGRHGHDAGEEILVLEGTLADELGTYPAGTYVRNPPGSSHAPFSDPGCTLLVKLRHLPAVESTRLVRGFREGDWQGPPQGIQRMNLFADEASGLSVYVSRFAPGARVPHHGHPGGEELFVLEGDLHDEFGDYGTGTWIRQPHGSEHAPYSEHGAFVLVRRGHLPR
jgi:anti-sigma factor ChrR (cupin superfamily)